MLKSIISIIKSQEQSSKGDIVANRKVIESPGGKMHLVPGHISDYVEHDDKTQTEFDVSRYVDSNYNWRRTDIKKTSKVDVTFPAKERRRNRINQTKVE